MSIKDCLVFTQGNDPKHTARKIEAWLSTNVTDYLVTPPNSPGINPIGNLWNHLDEKIRQHNILSKKNVINALQEERNKIATQITSHLVNSTSKKLESIFRFKGNPTKYSTRRSFDKIIDRIYIYLYLFTIGYTNIQCAFVLVIIEYYCY